MTVESSLESTRTAGEPGGTRAADRCNKILRRSVAVLGVALWTSGAIFAVYIVARYGIAAAIGVPERWNNDLARLYEPHMPAATLGIGVHFVAGAVLLALGPTQFIAALRTRMPAVHRWIGRVYVGAASVAGLGGLVFIAAKGTVGGAPMNVGFSLYGSAMVLAALQTWVHARRRQFDGHRRWAIRLLALTIGSWLYRMDYGFWGLLGHNLGHTHSFDGPFDVVMAFFFFIPNLLVAELIIRARPVAAGSLLLRQAAVALLAGATVFVVIGTYYFTRYHWGPDIRQYLF